MRSLILCTVIGMSAFGLLWTGPSAARAADAPAKIHVLLPADATLAIDGAPTQATSAVRDFVTPPLEAGKNFHYNLKAQFVRGDDTTTVERRITVRAGQDTNVSLGVSGASSDNVANYYNPAAPPSNFRPSVPFYTAPDLDVPHGGVGGARDNWKPDPSDPFYPWD